MLPSSHHLRGQAILSVGCWAVSASDARLMHQINVNRETLRWAAVNRLELLRRPNILTGIYLYNYFRFYCVIKSLYLILTTGKLVKKIAIQYRACWRQGASIYYPPKRAQRKLRLNMMKSKFKNAMFVQTYFKIFNFLGISIFESIFSRKNLTHTYAAININLDFNLNRNIKKHRITD